MLVRAQVRFDRIDLDLAPGRLVRWLLDEERGEGSDAQRQSRNSNGHANGAGPPEEADRPLIRLSIQANLKRTGNEMKFIVDGVANSAPADTTLIRIIVRGQKISKRMFAASCPPLEDIAAEEGISSTYATRLVRLTFLAPDIVAAILAGKHPALLRPLASGRRRFPPRRAPGAHP